MNYREPTSWCSECGVGHPLGQRCPKSKWRKNIIQKRAAKMRKHKSLKDFKSMLMEMQPNCNRCGVTLTKRSAELDHIKPLMRGGTNALNNLQLLCFYCHKNKTADEIKEGQRLNK